MHLGAGLRQLAKLTSEDADWRFAIALVGPAYRHFPVAPRFEGAFLPAMFLTAFFLMLERSKVSRRPGNCVRPVVGLGEPK